MRFVRRGRELLVGIALGLLGTAALPGGQNPKAEAVYTLADIPLSGFLAQEAGLPGVDDHNINLGGIGSDLWFDGIQGGDAVYWMITDRGPNGEDPRTFP